MNASKGDLLFPDFQLGRQTLGQIPVLLIAAAVNILLNIWWLPLLGVMGAAYATVLSYAVALSLSLLLGRKVFTLPPLDVDFFKVALTSLVSGVLLYASSALRLWLGLRLAMFIAVFASLFWLTDTARIRERLSQFLQEVQALG